MCIRDSSPTRRYLPPRSSYLRPAFARIKRPSTGPHPTCLLRLSNAIPGTDIAYDAIVPAPTLCLPCPIGAVCPGTGLRYLPTRLLRHVLYSHTQYSATSLRATPPVLTQCVLCYLPTLLLCEVRYWPSVWYCATSGTDVVYGAMRRPVLTYYAMSSTKITHGATTGGSVVNPEKGYWSPQAYAALRCAVPTEHVVQRGVRH
eukprot:3351125-Rhodomonas_salina.2